MESILHSETFFFISSIALVVVTTLLVVILAYVIRIIRMTHDIVILAKKKLSELSMKASDIEKGLEISSAVRWIFSLLTKRRKNKR